MFFFKVKYGGHLYLQDSHGGMWEAAVRLMKLPLNRILMNVNFTYEDFYTILPQVESILNSRPLCPVTGTPDNLC